MEKTNRNVKIDGRKIYLYDEIDQETSLMITSALISMIEKSVTAPITIYINSQGGSVTSTWAIVNTILSSKTPIYTHCLGKACSGALKIFLAGHRRTCNKYSEFMYHQLDGDINSKFKDLTEYSDYLEREQDRIENYMVNETRITKKKLKEIRDKKIDWYIFAEEALELGMVDEII